MAKHRTKGLFLEIYLNSVGVWGFFCWLLICFLFKEHVKNISVWERMVLRHWSAFCLCPCFLAWAESVKSPDVAQEQWWSSAWVAKERPWSHLSVSSLMS